MTGVSVIIPCHQAAATLPRCLRAIRREAQRCPSIREVIVVDDASTDGSHQLAECLGARLLRLPVNRGCCAARNAGAALAGESILWFLDADVEVRPGAADRLVRFFETNPGHAAVIGSYDDDPAAPGTVSQFKNLFHHYVHQQAPGPDVASFWTGCGAVRRTVFEQLGGFDDSFWPRATITDIDFGYRLGAAGHRIGILKDLQVRHLKAWRLGALIRTDMLQRALPWTILLFRHRGAGRGQLNLARGYRVSIVLVGLSAGLFGAGWLWHPAWAGALAALLGALAPHRRLLGWLARRRGARFLPGAVLLLWLYFLYCGLGGAAGLAVVLGRRVGLGPRSRLAKSDPCRTMETPR